jgi:FxsC-like protein
MAENGRAGGQQRGTYFFLSHAHSAPTSVGTDSDHWVETFYRDLERHVREMANPATDLDTGFYDGVLPPGADWEAARAAALSASEVFVPLYSPGYFQRSSALSEREAFRGRLEAAQSDWREIHVVPVLWTPLPPDADHPEIGAAVELVEDAPSYAENGLRALQTLSLYREQYDRIVPQLARRIVDAAERHPIGRSPSPIQMDVVEPPPSESDFIVAVIAPTGNDLPDLRDGDTYGATSRQWAPFGRIDTLPVAGYAVNTANRLGLPTSVVDFLEDPDVFEARPGILLVDPWMAAPDHGETLLVSMIGPLPEWVTTIVVVDQNDTQYDDDRGMKYEEVVLSMLDRVGVVRVTSARGVGEFVQLLPSVIAKARRQYLRSTSRSLFPVFRRLFVHEASHEEEDR